MVSSIPSRPSYPLRAHRPLASQGPVPVTWPRAVPPLSHEHAGPHLTSSCLSTREDTISLNYDPAPSRRPLIGPSRLLFAGHSGGPGKRKYKGHCKGKRGIILLPDPGLPLNYKSQQTSRLRRPALMNYKFRAAPRARSTEPSRAW